MLPEIDQVLLVLLFGKNTLRRFQRNTVKLLTSNDNRGYKQKVEIWSTKGFGGRQAPDPTTKKKKNT